jgi:hypothetical protein
MQRLTAPPPAAPPRGSLVKPRLELPPVKKLDEALLAILQRRKADAGILPGVPFN